MRIHNGFISNSSSSSFILMTTKEIYDDILAKLGPIDQRIIRALEDKGVITTSVGTGLPDLVVLATWSDSGGNDNFTDVIQDAVIEAEIEDPDFDPYDILDNYIKQVKKAGKYYEHEFGDGG